LCEIQFESNKTYLTTKATLSVTLYID
jgi:hypothetical protein